MGAQTIEDDNTSVVDDKKESRKGRECCKRFLKFLFSHIGLCGMVIAYTVAGGFIFMHLEQTNEKHECIKARDKYTEAENETTAKLWEISESYPSDAEGAQEQFQVILRQFRGNVLDLSYNGDDCNKYGKKGGPQYKWSFTGSLLFAVTVITTIGYGHIAPKTQWGRLVCIAYALLGIPLMLLCLANIGDVLADIFRYVYSRVCCCGCCRRKDKNKVESMKKERSSPEAWKEQYNNNQKGGGPAVVDDDDDDEEEEEEEEKISVPLTITMGIIFVYIVFGAVIFGEWEGWTMVPSAYFCFVTISTIGFGDLVPGSTNFESGYEYKLMLSSLYMLFGMAILSMCFSLIQEEIVAKFRWVGEKMGIVEKEQDPDEAEEDDLEEDEDEDDDAQKKPKGGKRPQSRGGKSLAAYPPPSAKSRNRSALPAKPGIAPLSHGIPGKKI